MNIFGNFLWKIFSATVVFFGATGGNCALADDVYDKYPTDEKMQKYCILRGNDTTTQYNTQPLCKIGTYLAGCGLATVGTVWLRGMTKIVENGNPIKTTNYYDYSTNTTSDYSKNPGVINMENLRKFFDGTRPLRYTMDGALTVSEVYPSDYIDYRNQILTNFCTDKNGAIAAIYCEKCPNGAMVAESTVETVDKDAYNPGKIVCDSWNIHTIADCYMTEFSDNTGTYVYVTDATEDKSGEACYYSTPFYGSALYYR